MAAQRRKTRALDGAAAAAVNSTDMPATAPAVKQATGEVAPGTAAVKQGTDVIAPVTASKPPVALQSIENGAQQATEQAGLTRSQKSNKRMKEKKARAQEAAAAAATEANSTVAPVTSSKQPAAPQTVDNGTQQITKPTALTKTQKNNRKQKERKARVREAAAAAAAAEANSTAVAVEQISDQTAAVGASKQAIKQAKAVKAKGTGRVIVYEIQPFPPPPEDAKAETGMKGLNGATKQASDQATAVTATNQATHQATASSPMSRILGILSGIFPFTLFMNAKTEIAVEAPKVDVFLTTYTGRKQFVAKVDRELLVKHSTVAKAALTALPTGAVPSEWIIADIPGTRDDLVTIFKWMEDFTAENKYLLLQSPYDTTREQNLKIYNLFLTASHIKLKADTSPLLRRLRVRMHVEVPDTQTLSLLWKHRTKHPLITKRAIRDYVFARFANRLGDWDAIDSYVAKHADLRAEIEQEMAHRVQRRADNFARKVEADNAQMAEEKEQSVAKVGVWVVVPEPVKRIIDTSSSAFKEGKAVRDMPPSPTSSFGEGVPEGELKVGEIWYGVEV
jgi:hypothetical protein